ncbi:MAG: hypothetical protein HY268_33565 [Deltaproteobacteria bacterium]|nr:hypothetical protein [Deltaproteobacteria bacterium]
MVGALAAIAQKVQGVPLDWWVLSVIFVGSLVLFLYADARIRRQQISAERATPLSIRTLSEPSLGDFTIDYAGLGLGFGQYRNVTDKVRKRVKDGKLEITVSPEDLEEEVYSGKPGKHLLVIYSYREDEGLCKKTDVYQRMVLP